MGENMKLGILAYRRIVEMKEFWEARGSLLPVMLAKALREIVMLLVLIPPVNARGYGKVCWRLHTKKLRPVKPFPIRFNRF
jgi:hypothetical protein